MATTTSPPTLESVSWAKSDESLAAPDVLTTVWAGHYTATGVPVSITQQDTGLDGSTFGIQADWDAVYGTVQHSWTVVTGDTAPTTNPIVIP